MIREFVLRSSAGYQGLRLIAGADRSMRKLVDQYIRPSSEMSVLDVGCGNADLAEMLPPGTTYLGIDGNQRYVEAARSRGHHVVLADVRELAEQRVGGFDVAVCLGLIHHLDNEGVDVLLAALRRVIRLGGRLVTMDPVFHPDQKLTARLLMAADRGKYVRHPGDYARLVSAHFEVKSVDVRHDLNWFPYSHCIVEALSTDEPSDGSTPP